MNDTDSRPPRMDVEALERMMYHEYESPTRRYNTKLGWHRRCKRCQHIQKVVLDNKGVDGFPQATHFCDGLLIVWPERWWT